MSLDSDPKIIGRRDDNSAIDRLIPISGLRLRVRQWDAPGVPFVLVHGLASNARTWDAVARRLNAAGHGVVAVDQRGHGLSDKPPTGYGFAEVTADLRALLDALDITRPIVAGQSWGGNVVLDFAARYRGVARGVVLVDGGYIEMGSGATWEETAQRLRPPDLDGMRRVDLADRIRRAHPEWTDEGVEQTLANFETLPDGTIRRQLSIDRHMEILRALWEHQPSSLYGRITDPVLVTVAESGNPADVERKRGRVERAEAGLARSRVVWFPATDHDIHVHRPDALAALLIGALADGFFD